MVDDQNQINNLSPPQLKRSLNLFLLVLYGLGTTIGAGIYVLVGAAAGEAGYYAPFTFILAAIALAPTAASFSELAGRMPVSAGETAYVQKAFNIRWLSGLTGWLVVISGIVASATIALGCVGYIRTFLSIDTSYLLIGITLVIGFVAIWGILESVVLASIFTIIEAGGLVFLIVTGFASEAVDITSTAELLSDNISVDLGVGMLNASMFAVFAFIGFEAIVNVAEETKNPRSSLPWAIFLTLGITALLYFLVTLVSVLAIPPEILAESEAPLSMVFQKIVNSSPAVISAIAIFATANTILVQFIMVSRVLYGMSQQDTLPKLFGQINSKTRTPIIATLLVVLSTLLLALFFPIEFLASFTAQIILSIWILINLSLIVIKHREDPCDTEAVIIPIWVPYIGMIFSAFLVIFSILS